MGLLFSTLGPDIHESRLGVTVTASGSQILDFRLQIEGCAILDSVLGKTKIYD